MTIAKVSSSARKMALLVLLLGLIAVVSGSEMTPLLAWSNDKSISESDSTVDSLLKAVESSSVSTVIVFAFDKLSFDDIAKYGGAYGNDNEATHLQSSMDSAQFQHFGGTRLLSREWVSDLGNKLNKQPSYVKNGESIDPNNKFLVVQLSTDDGFLTNDAVVGEVMDAIKSDSTYFVIYTEIPSEEVRHRSARSASTIQLQAADDGDQPAFTQEDCQIGGQFNYTLSDNVSNSEDERACLLFCLSSPLMFVPDATNTNGSCNLIQPYQITHNCSVSIDENTTDPLSQFYGRSYPSVSLYYSIQNGTNAGNLSTHNKCTNEIWENFPTTDPNRKEDLYMEMDVVLTFFFPLNFTYNDIYTKNYWAVMVSSIYTQRWVAADSERVTRPPDEEEYDGYVSNRTLLVRKDLPGLFQKFLVSTENSYACSASQFSVYTKANMSLDNGTLNIFGASSILNDSSLLTLKFLQVQPYNVSNKTEAEFRSADNCIGYFTEGSWMGVFSMLILIVIFYLAILCVFSMQSIDQYEDPRGQTISVDKLH